jgi:hypothetical protein
MVHVPRVIAPSWYAGNDLVLPAIEVWPNRVSLRLAHVGSESFGDALPRRAGYWGRRRVAIGRRRWRTPPADHGGEDAAPLLAEDLASLVLSLSRSRRPLMTALVGIATSA